MWDSLMWRPVPPPRVCVYIYIYIYIIFVFYINRGDRGVAEWPDSTSSFRRDGRGVAGVIIFTSIVLAAEWPGSAFSLLSWWPRGGRSQNMQIYIYICLFFFVSPKTFVWRSDDPKRTEEPASTPNRGGSAALEPASTPSLAGRKCSSKVPEPGSPLVRRQKATREPAIKPVRGSYAKSSWKKISPIYEFW